MPKLGVACPPWPRESGFVQAVEATAVHQNACQQAEHMSETCHREMKNELSSKTRLRKDQPKSHQTAKQALIRTQNVWCMEVPLAMDEKAVVKSNAGKKPAQNKRAQRAYEVSVAHGSLYLGRGYEDQRKGRNSDSEESSGSDTGKTDLT